MEHPVIAFAVTTGPRRPPPAPGVGVYAPVPLALRVCSAAVSILAVLASALLWLAEQSDPNGSTTLAAASLAATVLFAAAGLPVLFTGPMTKTLCTRDRRLGIAGAAILPALCWLMACWPAIATARGWS